MTSKKARKNRQAKTRALGMFRQGVEELNLLRYGVKRPARPKVGKPARGYTSSEEFFSSREWLELRYDAFQIYGRVCGCCGASPDSGVVLHVDHIYPRYKHPDLALDIRNLQILCERCNQGKGSTDTTDFRKKQVFKRSGEIVGARK